MNWSQDHFSTAQNVWRESDVGNDISKIFKSNIYSKCNFLKRKYNNNDDRRKRFVFYFDERFYYQVPHTLQSLPMDTYPILTPISTHPPLIMVRLGSHVIIVSFSGIIVNAH